MVVIRMPFHYPIMFDFALVTITYITLLQKERVSLKDKGCTSRVQNNSMIYRVQL